MHVATPFVLHQEKPRRAPAAVASATAHAMLFAALLLLRMAGHEAQPIASLPDKLGKVTVWLSEPGPGGGGGGGGNRTDAPARAAVMRGRDAMTVAAQKTRSLEPQLSPSEPTSTEPEISLRPLASGVDVLPGALGAPPGPPTSLGSGAQGGAGTGDEGGFGPGHGKGVGDGRDGNSGGGARAPGNGVTTPVVIREVRPAYTVDAMRAKVQGSVIVQCVVNPDGSVGDARVLRSLDSVFGLDQEALKAAKQWQFRPGTYRGKAVPVAITIELIFTLR